jgi:DNA polymerase beta
LNEFGLWRWRTGDADNPNSPVPLSSDEWGDDDALSEQSGYWELVRAESEEEILDELGMTFIQPDKRNFGFLLARNGQKRQKKV